MSDALSPVARALVIASGGNLVAAREAAVEARLPIPASELQVRIEAAALADASEALVEAAAGPVAALLAAVDLTGSPWGLANEAAIAALAAAGIEGPDEAWDALVVAQALLAAAALALPDLGDWLHEVTSL